MSEPHAEGFECPCGCLAGSSAPAAVTYEGLTEAVASSWPPPPGAPPHEFTGILDALGG